jgi:hypothetical protein
VTVRRGSYLAALLLAACATSNAERQDSLRTRAAFDLKCPAPSLKITELANDREMVSEKRMTSAGVEGCGQSRTYVYNGTQGVWMLDAVNGEPASSKPVSNDHAQKEANQ